MAKIALVADTCTSRAAYLEHCQIPAFYMEDFSVLGLVVSDVRTARVVLEEAGYVVVKRNGITDVHLQGAVEIRNALLALRSSNIASEFTDIADTMYQA